jgi:hypothetical protein
VLRVLPPDGQVAVRLGEVLRLEGAHLDGTGVEVEFGHALLDAPRTVVIGAHDDPRRLDVTLPSGAAAEQDWPAGVWSVAVRLVRPGEALPRTTNTAAVVLAPEPVLAGPAPTVVRDAGTGAVTVTIDVRPQVRPPQQATLALGSEQAVADPHPTQAGTLTFRFGVLPDGAMPVRLVVAGAESRLVDRATVPPTYDPAQVVVVPA